MSEYSETAKNEKSHRKKSDSNNPSNREMDYFGESPEKLDELISEKGRTDNNEKEYNDKQKNRYFGENPDKLDDILSLPNKNPLTNRKLDEYTKKPQDLNSIEKNQKNGKDPEKIKPLHCMGPGKLYHSPPKIVTQYTKDGKPVKVKVYPDGREEIIVGDKSYPISSKNKSPIQPKTTNKIKQIPIQKDLSNLKNASDPKKPPSPEKPISAPFPNKLLGKGDPTYILKKDSFLKDELNVTSKPYSKNKPNGEIDYLKIPIVKDPDILGKILKNSPKKISKKANKTNETGRMYYMINSDTNKRYIGQTTFTVNERLNKHFTEANSERDKTYINNSIRDHGQDKFTIHEFQQIENQKQWVLNKLETHYIAKYHTRDPRYGYNIAPGGRGGKHDERTIKKIKESNIKAKAHLKGIPLSEEHRKKISKGLTGLKKTEETKRKIAQSHKGMITSEETKKLLSDINSGEKNPFFGKKHTESTIKKMRDNKLGEKNPFHGKHHTETSKRLMSEANKGIPNTPEQKRKISETKIQNFTDANPINEDAFKNAVRNGATIKEIAEEFKLRRSAVHTWLGHLFGTSKITEAREESE